RGHGRRQPDGGTHTAGTGCLAVRRFDVVLGSGRASQGDCPCLAGRGGAPGSRRASCPPHRSCEDRRLRNRIGKGLRQQLATRIRVYELARELGLTNKETLDLCTALGIGVKSHSSSIEEAQADRVRRKADQEGLRREVQPEEPKKAKKTAKGEKAAPAEKVAAPEPAPGEETIA